MQSSDVQDASSHYDVFLSFRGTDTRKRFADHLYTALVKAGLRAFRDNEEIRRGESIQSEIENAIRGSNASIIVFSKDYASSKWCLRELALIMERRSRTGHHVLPVFYDVEPSKVKHQTGEYAKAFAKHEMRSECETEVEAWRKALREVGELSGLALDNRYEATFIEEIVNETRKKLEGAVLLELHYLAGRNYLVNQICSGQHHGMNVIGPPSIFGFSGLLEETTSKMASISDSYNSGGCSTLAKFREAPGGVSGLLRLHKDHPLDLLKRQDADLWNGCEDTVSSKVSMAMTESIFIEESVKEIGRKLHKTQLPPPCSIFEREDLISEINEWVRSVSEDVGMAAIVGMGGVRNTTVARIIYDLNYARFEGSSFVTNIREYCEGVGGFVRLQKQILSDLEKEKHPHVFNEGDGMMKIMTLTSCRRVLFVLDDVDDLIQVKAIVGMHEWFYPGSKVIITTRNENLYRFRGICKKFEIREAEYGASPKFLSSHAFGQDHPYEDYMQCIKEIMQRCSGLPVALQVIGSFLRGRTQAELQSTLGRLKATMHPSVHIFLAISYDSLSSHDKILFLDIACFFVGKDKAEVITTLGGCGSNVGIQILIDHGLLFVDKNNKIGMHDMLVTMAREIVRLESVEDPGKRSRVWHNEDALHVLRNEIGTETVRGLSLDLQSSQDVRFRKCRDINYSEQCKEEDSFGFRSHCSNYSFWNPLKTVERHLFPKSAELELRTDAFRNMHSLRLLQLNYVELRGSYEEFPRKLLRLCWHGFPLASIPKEFHPPNLIVLEMCNSKLKHNWKNGKVLQRLKSLDLSACQSLTRTPDLKDLPSLERLILKECINLVEVDDSIKHLTSLKCLNLRSCRNLRKLSKAVGMLKVLKELDLTDCPKLNRLPAVLGQNYSLRILHSNLSSTNESKSTIAKLNMSRSQVCYSVSQSRKSSEGISSLWNRRPLQPKQSLQNKQIRTCTKVHMQGASVGRAVDLSQFDSYEDLFIKLEELFDLGGELLTKKWLVSYIDGEDDMMMVGDDPWHEFCSLAKKILIHPLEEVTNVHPRMLSSVQCQHAMFQGFKGESSGIETQSSVAHEASTLNYDATWCYDVFLSFKRDDICANFANRLYCALVKEGVDTFRCDNEVKRREETEWRTERAVRESRMFIVVFSKSYASSRWCLDELEKIMERRRNSVHHILPIYYDIDPENVRKQTVEFADSFAGCETCSEEDMDKARRWIIATGEVAGLAGIILRKR